jgi:hypothetical protein
VSEIGRRLERLEALAGDGVDETAAERGERLRGIRERATNANARALRDGRIPPFEVSTDGYVSCSCDGRPVVTSHQTSAEEWYMRELEASYGHLIHDEEAETFRTHEGNLALSRYVVDIRYLIPDRPL